MAARARLRVAADKYYGSGKGGEGGTMSNLIIPIRGFIINTMPGDQTICQFERPGRLNAAFPMGGSGGFNYKWQESDDASSWRDASGPAPINQVTYQPPPLSDTIYYRRIVTDQTNSNLADTSFYVTVFVEPDLNNNLIEGDHTVCYNASPGVLSSSLTMSGGLGAGTYGYQWIRGTTSEIWSNAPGTRTLPSYAVPGLTDTTFYRRIVTSGVCVDTSNRVIINVLSTLTGNTIASDQTLCNNQVPAGLTGPVPAGGDPADKRYAWEMNSSGTWTPAGVTARNYTSIGSLTTGSYHYRRTVYSGSGDACISTSNEVVITVLPDISGNKVYDGDTVICAGLPSLDIHGNVPSGGNSPSYKYIWQTRLAASSTWNPADPLTVNQPFEPGTLNADTWIRRLVYSGAGDVCQDISDSIKISTLPVITGNTISTAQTVCEGIRPADLNGSIPSGGGEGPGTYAWKWQKKTLSEPSFADVAGGNQKNFSFSLALHDTTVYRRIVLSGPTTFNTCKDTSNVIVIAVPPAIDGNRITGATERETCVGTQPPVIGAATGMTGGNGSFSFRWEESDDGASWSMAYRKCR